MKNKKGFTLIELLAVIVILAIIALIAIPVVLNMIESARKSAAKSAALGYIDAIEYNNGFASIGSDAGVGGYTSITGGDVSTINTTLGNHIKGKKPTSGSVTVDSNGKVTGATDLCFNGYKVSYDGKDVTTITKGCGSSNNNNNTPVQTVYYYRDKSDKKNQPDSSWKAYIKEIQQDVTASSDIYEIVVDSSHSSDTGFIYTSLEDCQSAATGYNVSPDSCVVLYSSGSTYQDINYEACLNSSTKGELCLKYNDYTNTEQKIKTYFGYNNSWTETSGNHWDNSNQTASCEFVDSNSTWEGMQCADLTELIQASAGYVDHTVSGNAHVGTVALESNVMWSCKVLFNDSYHAVCESQEA